MEGMGYIIHFWNCQFHHKRSESLKHLIGILLGAGGGGGCSYNFDILSTKVCFRHNKSTNIYEPGGSLAESYTIENSILEQHVLKSSFR